MKCSFKLSTQFQTAFWSSLITVHLDHYEQPKSTSNQTKPRAIYSLSNKIVIVETAFFSQFVYTMQNEKTIDAGKSSTIYADSHQSHNKHLALITNNTQPWKQASPFSNH